MNPQDPGYILFVADPDTPSVRDAAGWTVQWILAHELPLEGTVYFCQSALLAEQSLVEPLSKGESPSLVVIDHALSDPGIARFAERLRACIPETWVIELVSEESPIPHDPTAFVVKKPFPHTDWDAILDHIYLKARSPQWSRAIG